jgi:hypothetical protein
MDVVDELRAAPVGRAGDRTRKLLLARRRGQLDDLAWLDIGAEAGDQLGKAVDRGFAI